MSKARASIASDVTFAVEPAAIVAIDDDGRLAVRVGAGNTGARTREAKARLAHLPGYSPAPGDRVLVAQGPDGLYAIGVLHAAHPPRAEQALSMADGSSAVVVDGALEVRDPAGNMVIRYAEGTAEVSAPGRDLVLSAPNGEVRVSAAMDIRFEASRDLVQKAARNIGIEGNNAQLRAARLDVQTKAARVVAGKTEVLLRTLATTAETIVTRVSEQEVSAERLISRAKEAISEVKGLWLTRAGRSKTEVEGAYSVKSERTELFSKEETTVDGKKILLG